MSAIYLLARHLLLLTAYVLETYQPMRKEAAEKLEQSAENIRDELML